MGLMLEPCGMGGKPGWGNAAGRLAGFAFKNSWGLLLQKLKGVLQGVSCPASCCNGALESSASTLACVK